MDVSNAEMTRFDVRLSVEQKEFFEYASKIGGYRSLNEFVLHAAQAMAEEIEEKHGNILFSQRDRDAFFNVVFKGTEPTQELKSALNAYKGLL